LWLAQSSPELVSNRIDPNSAADFYGLFDAQGAPANQAEEQKVSNPPSASQIFLMILL
jgi:hypothetical protein